MTTYIVVEVKRARIVVESVIAIGLMFLRRLWTKIPIIRLSNLKQKRLMHCNTPDAQGKGIYGCNGQNGKNAWCGDFISRTIPS